MFFSLTTSHHPATDLGYLLHKNPDKVHERALSFGRAIMFYPQADEDRCTFALLLDVDPIGLVRGSGKGKGARAGGMLDQYVNDRPYATSSLLSVALARSLATALSGRSKERQELAETALPFEVVLTPVPLNGQRGVDGAELAKRLFEPLGYELTMETMPLDEHMPEWGDSPYVTLTLKGEQKLQTLLQHVYVLLPVLDNSKHYFIDTAEVDKLVAKGEGWLEQHPARDLITRRYLKRRGELVREALLRLQVANEDEPSRDEGDHGPRRKTDREQALEKPLRIHEVRLETVKGELLRANVKSVVDLGCGEGRLLEKLKSEKQFTRILGVDASSRVLEWAEKRLKLDWLPEHQSERIRLVQGALTYRDKRIHAFDAATLIEVIEHLDEDRLAALERVVFEFAAPRLVIVTTPNSEYNVLFENLDAGCFRHKDHRFEWTREQFAKWVQRVAGENGYGFEISPIGEEHPEYGALSQMAVFAKTGGKSEK